MEEAGLEPLLARVEGCVVRALDRADSPTPAALLFLLRRYVASNRADVAGQVERGLAVALARSGDAKTTIEQADWLRLFVEAAQASEDDRLPHAIASLVALLSSEWATHSDVERGAASIDACLHASDPRLPRDLVQRAVDELERIVPVAYTPGGHPRSVAESVRLASALLTAFAITARIPYAMLAEELVQSMRRAHWNDATALFSGPADLNCEAARVLSRIAALHRDEEYRGAAVLAPDADYERDLVALLQALAPHVEDDGFPAGVFGLALMESGESDRWRT